MGMKPRLDQPNKKIDPKLCSEPCHAPDSETDANIPNTVSSHKPMANVKIDPKLVSGPHNG